MPHKFRRPYLSAEITKKNLKTVGVFLLPRIQHLCPGKAAKLAK
jgi:hypothetical protein